MPPSAAPTPCIIPSPRYDALSFVMLKPEGGFNYWAFEPSGDYSADCDKGRELGQEYLAFVGQYPTNGNATLLHCIVDSMMAGRREPATKWGRYTTGLEIGFLSAVNGYAMATATIIAQQPTAA